MSDCCPKLSDLVNELNNVAIKWYDIGLQLGLEDNELDNIRSDGGSNRNKERLREMLKEWLKKINPPPSWRALIAALRKPSVREEKLASELERKFYPEEATARKGSTDEAMQVDQDMLWRPRSSTSSSAMSIGSSLVSPMSSLSSQAVAESHCYDQHYPCTRENILQAIVEVSNCRVLGSQLGLLPYELDEIQQKSRNIQEQKTRIVDAWLDKDKDPTWEKFLGVLRAPSMGENTVAMKIDCLRRGSSSSTVSMQLSTPPTSPVYGEFTIPRVVNTIADQVQSATILGSILGVPQLKLSLIDTYPPCERIQRMVEAWFASDPGAKWSKLETALLQVSPSNNHNGSAFNGPIEVNGLSMKSQPEVNGSHILPQVEGLNSDSDVKAGIDKFQLKFSDLHEKILEELENSRNITVQSFRRRITGLPNEIKKEHYYYIMSNIRTLKKFGNLDEIFLHLNLYWNFIDYSLLQYIIQTYGSPGLKKEMEDYVSDMTAFQRRTTVSQLMKFWPGNKVQLPPHFSLLTLKLDIDPNVYTVNQLDQLRKSVCKEYCSTSDHEFKLSEFALKILDMRPGSLLVVWLLPSELVEGLRYQIYNSNNLEFFEDHKILTMSLDGEVVEPQGNSNVKPKLLSEYEEQVDSEKEQLEELTDETLLETQVDQGIEQLSDELRPRGQEQSPIDEPQDEEDVEQQSTRWWKRLTDWTLIRWLNMRLIWAARRGKADSVLTHLKRGAQPNCTENDLFRWTPLNWASHNGHIDVVRILLNQGADPNRGAAVGKWTPLILASRNGYHEIVDLLIKSGANVDTKNSFGWNALMWASQYRDYLGAKKSTDLKKKENLVKVAELLLKNGADPNVEGKDGWSPAMQASQDGNDTFVKLLAEKGADLNHKDKKQQTFPLMIAVSKGHNHVVKELINGGAQLDLTNKKKQTALHIACYKKHEKIVEQIVENTRNTSVIDAQDELGLSPIMIGAKQKSVKIVELLRNAKANLNLQAEKYAKWTPLMFAVKSGNRQIVETLLQSGADVRLRDANGQSLIGIAKAFNRHMVQDLMDYYNDDVSSASTHIAKPIAKPTAASGAEMELKVVHEKRSLETVHEPKDVDTAVDPTSVTTDPANKQAHKESTASTATMTRETEQAVNRRKILQFLEQEIQAETHTIDSQQYNAYNKQYERMYTSTIAAAA